MSGLTLPISDVVQVNVSVAAAAIPPKSFNQGLIVGPSPVIPSYGANSRLRQYASVNAMLADGFISSEPEFIAAELYFGQNAVAPFVWIGRQDLTAIATLIPHAGNAGTGYVVGDIVNIVQGGATHGQATVLTAPGGVVATLGVVAGSQGTGYAIANGLTTTGGTGVGLEVDITAIGESYLQAVEACYLVNQDWYGFMCCNAVDADHLALGAYSTANWQTVFYFGSTADAAVLAGTANNIALQLQALKSKMLLTYDTSQSGLYPNNLYAAAAVLGLYCGLNTGLAGSAFTLNLKSLVGVAPEPLTQTQYNTLLSQGCNSCVTYGPYIGYFATGVLPSGNYFDQILDRAMLVNFIQTNLMNLLISVPKVPQTDAGEHQLIAQVEQACAAMVTIGFLGAGVWTGPAVLNLATGQSLPLGYLVQAQSFALQSSGDRGARKAMPIYACILESGAVQSVVVQVNTQS
jgi:hypothetical protein